MRRFIYACAGLLLFALSAHSENIFPGGDFTGARDNLAGIAFANGGRVSLCTEELTWSKCGRLEVLAPTTNNSGIVTWNATALVGSSDGKTPGMAVEGGKTYDFSLELRGDSDDEIKAGVGAFAWDKGQWVDGKNVKATVSRVLLQKTWTVVKGSFTVPEGKTRAAIRLQLWASSQYPPVRLKEGDCLYFDNIKVEESAYSLSALDDDGKAVSVEPRKAVAVGETLRDFLVFERGRGAKTPTDAVAAKVTVDGDSLVITVSEKLPNGEARRGNAENVWSGDAAEVFFAPSSGKSAGKVVQFAWNAADATFAKNAAGPFKIDGNMIRDGKWSSRVRIPFAALGLDAVPENGETMPFNIAVNGGGEGLCACWSPVKEGFGDAKRFGTLVFGTYGDSLKRRFGLDAVDADRAEYEKNVAELEAEALKKKFNRFAGKPFTVSIVPVDSDFACPFVPREAFNPVEAISLKGAVNEKVGLPVAILNLTDKAETYVVRIETDTADREKPWAEKQMNGTWGLDGFPPERMTAREALRFKDTDNEPVTTRLEMLPKMNEACTIIVPPKEAGLVWFDFDCADVKPATYRGRLRVIPLSQASKFDSWKGGFHTRMYSGQMQDVPVSLEVRPIVLDREPAQPFGFFQDATTEGQFDLMADIGTRDFQVSPWSFNWAVEGTGRTYDFSRPCAGVSKAEASVKKTIELAKRRGFRPTFFIGFNAYPVFCGNNGCKDDPEKALVLWPQWLKGVKKCMNAWGVADADYVVEVFDEPSPSKFGEIKKALAAAKEAAGSVRLLITLGAHVMSADDMRHLDQYIDGWVLWSHGYFSRPEHLAYVKEALAAGKTVWHYTCGTSAREPIYETYRLHPWFGWRHSLTGNQFFIFQDMLGGYGPVDFKKAASSGIAYRSFESTMPSLRYMSMRRGVEDLKYLAKLREVAGGKPEVKAFLADAPIRVLETERHVKSTADAMREKAAGLILKYGDKARGATK